MEHYRILEELGDGSCGRVFKAIDLRTREIVAVKKMKQKYYNWEECLHLREFTTLGALKHPNIIRLEEIVQENDELFFIFEFMENSLYQTIKSHDRPISEEMIRDLMAQLLLGLSYMHGKGYFHRDLKPENILVTNSTLKIADFGLAREFHSTPPYTEYVSTRWYRAPEVLLHSSSYTSAIDMWAVGVLMAELFTLNPLFPGQGEIDQLNKICNVLGAPDWNVFPDAQHATSLLTFNFLKVPPVNWSAIIPNASVEAVDLIQNLCSWDPSRRLSAAESLKHPFFNPAITIPQQLYDPLELSLNSFASTHNVDLNRLNFRPPPDELFLDLSLAVNPSINYAEAPVSDTDATVFYLFPPFVDPAAPLSSGEQSSFLSLSCNPAQNGSESSSMSWPFDPMPLGSGRTRFI